MQKTHIHLTITLICINKTIVWKRWHMYIGLPDWWTTTKYNFNPPTPQYDHSVSFESGMTLTNRILWRYHWTNQISGKTVTLQKYQTHISVTQLDVYHTSPTQKKWWNSATLLKSPSPHTFFWCSVRWLQLTGVRKAVRSLRETARVWERGNNRPGKGQCSAGNSDQNNQEPVLPDFTPDTNTLSSSQSLNGNMVLALG